MEISKSSRHREIIRNFGVNLTCNWLSRSGFEVEIADRTGIDIIADNKAAKKRIGIKVKSRTRNIGTEDEVVNLFEQKNDDRDKFLAECKKNDCEPWIAVYVETEEYADIYLTSLKNYDEQYKSRKSPLVDSWKMTKEYWGKYEKDSEIKHIKFEFCSTNWKW